MDIDGAKPPNCGNNSDQGVPIFNPLTNLGELGRPYKYSIRLSSHSYSIPKDMAISLLPPFTLHLFLLSSVFFFFLFLISFFSLGRKSAAPCKKSPPSPRNLPIIGNLHQLGSHPHRSLGALSHEYGPVMLLHFGRVPAIIVSSTEMAQEIMKIQDLTFASRPPSRIAKRLLRGKDIAFSPYGEHWRQVRRISVLHMLSLKRVLSFRPVREDEVALMVERIRSSSCNGPVNLSSMLNNLTNDIVCRAALGKKFSEGKRSLEPIIKEFVVLMGKLSVGDFIPSLSWLDKLSGLDARVEKNFREMDACLDEVIEDHLQLNQVKRSRKERKDFVDILLSLDAEDEKIGASLDRETIKALILDIYGAGADTTFTAIEWTLAKLLKHPQAMKRAQNEIRNVVGRKERVTEDDIEKMAYLKAVIKESLRLHPPAPLLVPHESMEDTQLQAFHIPKGTMVIINAWAIGRDPGAWERPDEFLPERFLNSTVDFRGQDFQFIPFGAGRRGCPGIGFAISTIELSVTNLLYHFDWALPDGAKGEDLDMTETASSLTVHKKASLILLPIPHQPA